MGISSGSRGPAALGTRSRLPPQAATLCSTRSCRTCGCGLCLLAPPTRLSRVHHLFVGREEVAWGANVHSVHVPDVFPVVVGIAVLSSGTLALHSFVALVARLAMGRAVPRECASVWFRFDVLYMLQQT